VGSCVTALDNPGGARLVETLGEQRILARDQRIPKRGKAALDAFYRRAVPVGRPLLFLDFDDVLCLQKPYGGHHLFQAHSERPGDLWERLWHPPAAQTLVDIVEEHRPHIVITTSWLRLMDRDGFIALFHRTGLGVVADGLHEAWKAPQDRGRTRQQAIETWLYAQYEGQPLVILDDELSGTGLHGSRLDKAGCVVLCSAGVGLHAGHLPAVRSALIGGGGRL